MAQEDILEQPAIPARPLQLDDGETDTNLRMRYGIYYMSPELDDILTNHIIYFQCYMSLESDDILNLSYNFTSNRFIRNSVNSYLLAASKSPRQLRFEASVANLEQFEMSNENLIARDDLPCESDEKLQLQCASVRHIVRWVVMAKFASALLDVVALQGLAQKD